METKFTIEDGKLNLNKNKTYLPTLLNAKRKLTMYLFKQKILPFSGFELIWVQNIFNFINKTWFENFSILITLLDKN